MLAASTAIAAPPISFQLGGGGGIGWAHRAGWYRDDNLVELRFGVGIGDFVALDAGVSEDTARIEPALRIGARVRPWEGACWRARWSPYLRGEVALVGASQLGSNYDLLAGVGHWGQVSRQVAWLGWYAELDGIARVGEYDSWSLRVAVGVSFATPTFWR
jgi:hypothetical protein